jgi:geranylgeranyl pyrophosphate synthase
LSTEDARRVAQEVRSGDAPERAIAVAREHASAALRQLDGLPAGEARDALAALTDYVVTRKL